MDFLVRIASLVRKELLAVLRDKKSRLALIIPPIIQIAIFGYAATMNVTRVPYAVLDKDGGEAASQYIADLEGTGIFQRQAFHRDQRAAGQVVQYGGRIGRCFQRICRPVCGQVRSPLLPPALGAWGVPGPHRQGVKIAQL